MKDTEPLAFRARPTGLCIFLTHKKPFFQLSGFLVLFIRSVPKKLSRWKR